MAAVLRRFCRVAVLPRLLVWPLVLAAPAVQAIPIETVPLSGGAPAAAPVRPEAPSAPVTAAATPEAPSMMWNLYQQVQRLEQEVRSLRGRLEGHDQQLDQVQNDLKNRFTDLDQRLVAAQTASDAPNRTDLATSAATPEPVNPTTAPSVTAAGPAADQRDYLAAYDAYKTGGAAKAIEPMRAFIDRYPNSSHIANANYWLGEFYLANNPPDFARARGQFERVVQQYPGTAKVPAALYRLATLADVDGRRSEALRLMTRLDREFADSKEAGFARTYLKTHSSAAKPASSTTSKTPAVKPAAKSGEKPSAPTKSSPASKPPATKIPTPAKPASSPTRPAAAT